MTTALVRLKVSAKPSLMREIEQAGLRKLRRRLDAIGTDAVRRCDQIVSAEFVNDRIPERRKAGRHLLGSFRYEIIDGDDTLSLRLYSLANPQKVNALERGAGPHVIVPVNAEFLVFPRGTPSAPGARKRGASQVRQGYRGQTTGQANVRTKYVNHPGNRPHNMMKRALDAAVAAAL